MGIVGRALLLKALALCSSLSDYGRWFALNRVLIGEERDSSRAYEHYKRALDLLQVIDATSVEDTEIQYLLTTAYSTLHWYPQRIL